MFSVWLELHRTLQLHVSGVARKDNDSSYLMHIVHASQFRDTVHPITHNITAKEPFLSLYLHVWN